MSMTMLVSIPLTQVGGRETHELRLELGEEAGVNVSSVQQRSTAAALLGYFDEKARTDQELSEERTQHLRYRQQDVEAGSTSDAAAGEEKDTQTSLKSAELMGRRVRDIGDEFMAQIYQDPRLSSYVDSMVNRSEDKSATQSAFNHFCEVANILLQCNESGIAQEISIGRIAAMFSYCYHLCKVYIFRRGIMGVVGFLGQLLSYLIRCLYRSKFYEWLSSRGGWVHLLKQTYHIVPALSSPHLVAPVIILGGALLLGYIVYKYS